MGNVVKIGNDPYFTDDGRTKKTYIACYTASPPPYVKEQDQQVVVMLILHVVSPVGTPMTDGPNV
jgi:hypothetical protein